MDDIFDLDDASGESSLAECSVPGQSFLHRNYATADNNRKEILRCLYGSCNKRNMQVGSRFPELREVYRNAGNRCILDGEVVVLVDGVPDFYRLQKRTLLTDRFKIELESKRFPASIVAFDCIYKDRQELVWEPLMERKQILSQLVSEDSKIAISRYVETEGRAL